jgi:hypothetical protein
MSAQGALLKERLVPPATLTREQATRFVRS